MRWGDLFKWLGSPKATVGVVSTLAAAFALGGSIAADGLFGQVTAAWVQAIGSIAAITAAIWIAGRQFRQSEFHRWESDANRISVALHLAKQAVDAIAEAQSGVEAGKATFTPTNFQTVQAALDEVPLLDLPAGKAAISIVNLRRAVAFYNATYQKWLTALEQFETWETVPSEGGVSLEGLAFDKYLLEKELCRLQNGVLTSHNELIEIDAIMDAIRPM